MAEKEIDKLIKDKIQFKGRIITELKNRTATTFMKIAVDHSDNKKIYEKDLIPLSVKDPKLKQILFFILSSKINITKEIFEYIIHKTIYKE